MDLILAGKDKQPTFLLSDCRKEIWLKKSKKKSIADGITNDEKFNLITSKTIKGIRRANSQSRVACALFKLSKLSKGPVYKRNY